ncbi:MULTISPECIES: hypothetical protein [unclassified Okeania]|nr:MULTISPECIES: hypothetical protein [unclassified Okeania]
MLNKCIISQESGVRRQETGDRRQETGDRNQESEKSFSVTLESEL